MSNTATIEKVNESPLYLLEIGEISHREYVNRLTPDERIRYVEELAKRGYELDAFGEVKEIKHDVSQDTGTNCGAACTCNNHVEVNQIPTVSMFQVNNEQVQHTVSGNIHLDNIMSLLAHPNMVGQIEAILGEFYAIAIDEGIPKSKLSNVTNSIAEIIDMLKTPETLRALTKCIGISVGACDVADTDPDANALKQVSSILEKFENALSELQIDAVMPHFGEKK